MLESTSYDWQPETVLSSSLAALVLLCNALLLTINYFWSLQATDWTASVTPFRSPNWWTMNTFLGLILLYSVLQLVVLFAPLYKY